MMLRSLTLTVRPLTEPSLWYWEIRDETGMPVESSWTSAWTAFESVEEARAAGTERLAQLLPAIPGTEAPLRDLARAS